MHVHGRGVEEIIWCGVCICMFVGVFMFTTLVVCLCVWRACMHAGCVWVFEIGWVHVCVRSCVCLYWCVCLAVSVRQPVHVSVC